MIAHIANLANTNLVLDVCGSTTNPGASLILYKFHGDLNQQFEIRDNQILVVRSNLALEVSGGLKSGNKVIQNTPSDSEAQKFYLMSDGTIQTSNGLCLDVEGGKMKPNTQIIVTTPNGSNHQKFRLFTRKKL